MDALSGVLRVTHLTGGVFCTPSSSAPWCMAARVRRHYAPALDQRPAVGYHYVVEGDLRIELR
jgi:hypothetical protein